MINKIKMTKSEAGKLGEKASHKLRYDTLRELSKYETDKAVLDWYARKWKTPQLVELLKAFKNG